jgi:DNA repair protein RadC
MSFANSRRGGGDQGILEYSGEGLHDRERVFHARVTNESAEDMTDADLLEAVLVIGRPQADNSAEASKLLAEFKSLPDALAADVETLRSCGTPERTILALKVVREAALRMLKPPMNEHDVISSWSALVDYCTARMACDSIEAFRVVYLDRKNRVIRDEEQQRGTVDHTPCYPREIVKRCIQLDASAVIMVHNHPSGDPVPSRADIEMTHKVKNAAAAIGVTLHDHVVVSRGGHVSFRMQGLLS